MILLLNEVPSVFDQLDFIVLWFKIFHPCHIIIL